MFIEVTSNREKYLVNTDNIMMVAKNDDWGVEFEQSMLTFSHPLTIRGTNKLAVKETYDELKKLLK